jgi:hypothetical protein
MRGVCRIASILGLCGLLAPGMTGGAVAQTTGRNPSHEDILRGLDAAAFWASREDVSYGGSYNPTGFVIKWTGEIRYRIDGFTYNGKAIETAVGTLRRQADVAGVVVREAATADAANFTIVFENVEVFRLGSVARRAGCYMEPSYDESSGRMTAAVLHVNLAKPAEIDRCIVHETLHGFGLLNHPHKLHSVLSYYTQRLAFDLTEADIVMLKTLYDPRLKAGMRRLQALQLADGIIEEKRRALTPAAPARTDTAHVLREAAADLEAAASQGNVKAMLHLAQAHRIGAVVAKDQATSDGWLDRAAALPDGAARFDLAYALAGGHYGIRDDARAVAIYRPLAMSGHRVAQNNLAVLLRDGRGVEQDRTEALFWFTVAATSGYPLAERNRKRLADQLGEPQSAEAVQRAAAWKPGPEAAR